MAVVMRAAATDVDELVIANSGHWLMEEQRTATIAAARAFLTAKRGSTGRQTANAFPLPVACVDFCAS